MHDLKSDLYLGRVRKILRSRWQLLLSNRCLTIFADHRCQAGFGELKPQLDKLFFGQEVFGVVALHMIFKPA